MNLPRETAVLQNIEHTFPFNNFTDLYLLYGKKVHEKFGGTCLASAVLVRRRLLEEIRGIKVNLHNSVGIGMEGHVIAISDDGLERKLYDPYHLMQEPLSYTTYLREGFAEVKTFPEYDGKCRRVFIHSVGGNDEFCGMYGVRDADNRVIDQDFMTGMYPLFVPETDRQPFSPIMAAKPHDKLLLHILERDNSKSEVVLDTANGTMQAGKIIPNVQKTAETNKAGFQSEMTRIAKHMGVGRKRLEEFFRDGWKLYQVEHPDYERPKV